MVLEPGEKIHVITRRLFEHDLRRHFAGEVLAATEHLARVEGFAFVFSSTRNEFARRPDRRVRIVALGDGRSLINVMPSSVDVEKLRYETVEGPRLIVTDGRSFRMDVNEFSAGR